MATHARQQYFADESSLSKEKREFSIADEIQEKIDSVEEGAQVNKIETVKVNGTALVPDANKAVNVDVPEVIDNLYTVAADDALSAKQGKLLYDYIQNLQTIGRFLSNWDSATGLPITNPSESPYLYKAGDYYRVSNVAVSPALNYKPNGSSFIIGQASTTVETNNINISDLYLYDGTTWILLSNSGSSIAVDSSLSTTSTNPVENRVITNALNGKQETLVAGSNIQIAADGKTISATDTTYSAGANISIDANNEISAVDTTYTAGTNVQISNQNVISATDTKYTAGTGINIDANNEISNTLPGAIVSATAPSNPTEGMVWYDTTNDSLKAYNGTSWETEGTKMVVLEYGVSTWQDFLDAYNKNAVVYCKVSSGSSGYRMAFMAYTAGRSTPTEVEFQYYRSRSSHSTAANQLDEVYVYKLTNAGVWTTTQRDTAAKAIAGTGIGLTYNSSGMTISADTTTLATKTDLNSKQDTLVSGTNIKTVNSTSLLGSGNVAVQETLVSGTNIKTVNSTSLLGSGNIAVQPTLVSGTNIKTINGNSLLGSGNITIDESSFKVFTVADLDDSTQCYEVYSRVREEKPAVVIYDSHAFYYTNFSTSLGITKFYFHTMDSGEGSETIFELVLEASTRLYRWDEPTEVNLGGAEIEYVTQAEYNALPSSKLTDNKHYFIYTSDGPTPPVLDERPDIDSFSLTTTVASGQSRLHAVGISGDGSNIYIGKDTTNLSQHTATDGNLSNYSSSTVSSISYQSRGLWCKPDGTKLYDSHDNGDIYQVNMSTPYSLSGSTVSTYATGSKCCGISLSHDGSRLYHGVWGSAKTFYEYTLSTPRDVSSRSTPISHTVDVIQSTTGDGPNIYQTQISPTGKKMYFYADQGMIYQYNLSTPYDWSTATYYGSLNVGFGARGSFQFTADGQRIILGNLSNKQLYQYDAS